MVVLVVNPAAGVAHAVLVFVALERAINMIPAVNSRRHVSSLGKFNSVATDQNGFQKSFPVFELSRTGTMEQIGRVLKM